MTEWPLVSLEEIAAPGRYSVVGGPFGSALGRKDYVDDGVPVIRGAQLGGPGWFSHEDLVYVSQDKADRHPGNLAYPGDVLVTQRGTVGQVGLIPVDAPFERYLLSQSQMKLTVDPARANARFVYYWLRSSEAQDAMVGSTISAGVPHINLATFKGMKLPLPSLPEQERVADVLGSVDDLIENNRRRVEVLEEMARAIYREWFVRFRYPGHEEVPLVDSPLGSIPDGWTVCPLIEIADLTMGQSPKSEFYNSDGVGRPFHQGVADFGRHYPTHRKFCTVDARLAHDGDVLVSVRAPVGRINLADTTLVIGRGLAAVRSTRGQQSFLLATLREVFAEEDSMGGGTIFNAIGKTELQQVQVLQPPDSLATMANDRLESVFQLIRSLTFTGRELAAIRDLLLPRLVTGQIDVSHLDLDGLTEAATA